MLSLTAAAAGIRLETGILCIDSCNAYITDKDPLSGLSASVTFVYGGWQFFPVLPLIPGALLVPLLIAGVAAGRWGHVLVGSVCVVAGYAALYF